MRELSKPSMTERYWPYLLGLGIGSNVYLRNRANPNGVDVLLGGVGLVLILLGLNGARESNKRSKTVQPAVATNRDFFLKKENEEATAPVAMPQQRLQAIRREPVLWSLIGFYLLSAIFICVHVPTTVGERWVWQLHRFEAKSDWDVKPIALADGEFENAPSATSDPYSQFREPSTSTQIELLPMYLVLHQFEALGLLLLALFVVFFKTEGVTRFRHSIGAFIVHYSIAICGIAFVVPLLFVPCTYEYHSHYSRAYDRNLSEYRWLWKVGDWNIKFGVLSLEEIIVAGFAGTCLLHYRRFSNN